MIGFLSYGCRTQQLGWSRTSHEDEDLWIIQRTCTSTFPVLAVATFPMSVDISTYLLKFKRPLGKISRIHEQKTIFIQIYAAWRVLFGKRVNGGFKTTVYQIYAPVSVNFNKMHNWGWKNNILSNLRSMEHKFDKHQFFETLFVPLGSFSNTM